MDYTPTKILKSNELNKYSNYVLYNNQQAETDKCVVLDIDETCVHSFEDSMPIWLRDPQYRDILSNCYEIHPVDAVDDAGTGNMLPMWGIRRPHLTEFLVFCQKYFRHILVWSAGAKHYVHEVVRAMFAGLPSPTLIYTRDDIPPGPTTKPLPIILNDNSIRDSGCSLQTTYIIDDRYDYFMTNPNNGVQIPAYSPPITPESLRADDQSLLVLKWWLSMPSVRSASDIRSLDKAIIFTYSAQYWEQKSATENSSYASSSSNSSINTSSNNSLNNSLNSSLNIPGINSLNNSLNIPGINSLNSSLNNSLNNSLNSSLNTNPNTNLNYNIGFNSSLNNPGNNIFSSLNIPGNNSFGSPNLDAIPNYNIGYNSNFKY